LLLTSGFGEEVDLVEAGIIEAAVRTARGIVSAMPSTKREKLP
jgi:hypothetical protein